MIETQSLTNFLEINYDRKIKKEKGLEKLIPLNHKINLEYFFEDCLEKKIHPYQFFDSVKKSNLLFLDKNFKIDYTLKHSLVDHQKLYYLFLYYYYYLVKYHFKDKEVIQKFNKDINLLTNLELLVEVFFKTKKILLN